MNILQRTAAAVLSGLCLVGAAAAVNAHHIPQQSYSTEGTKSLLQAATSVGIQVITDKTPGARKYCKKGLYGAANASNQLLICIENHGDDVDELADTIRHELVHSAQFCKGRSVGATSALLYPDLRDKALQGAIELHMPVDRYKPAQYAAEAEARVLAQLYNDQQVANLLRRYC
jgi:hypothetical protein